MHEFTMAGTVCKRFAQDQVKEIPSMDGGGDDEVQPLAEELFVVDQYWERESHFSSERQVLRVYSCFSRRLYTHAHIGNVK